MTDREKLLRFGATAILAAAAIAIFAAAANTLSDAASAIVPATIFGF